MKLENWIEMLGSLVATSFYLISIFQLPVKALDRELKVDLLALSFYLIQIFLTKKNESLTRSKKLTQYPTNEKLRSSSLDCEIVFSLF